MHMPSPVRAKPYSCKSELTGAILEYTRALQPTLPSNQKFCGRARERRRNAPQLGRPHDVTGITLMRATGSAPGASCKMRQLVAAVPWVTFMPTYVHCFANSALAGSGMPTPSAQCRPHACMAILGSFKHGTLTVCFQAASTWTLLISSSTSDIFDFPILQSAHPF